MATQTQPDYQKKLNDKLKRWLNQHVAAGDELYNMYKSDRKFGKMDAETASTFDAFKQGFFSYKRQCTELVRSAAIYYTNGDAACAKWNELLDKSSYDMLQSHVRVLEAQQPNSRASPQEAAYQQAMKVFEFAEQSMKSVAWANKADEFIAQAKRDERFAKTMTDRKFGVLMATLNEMKQVEREVFRSGRPGITRNYTAANGSGAYKAVVDSAIRPRGPVRTTTSGVDGVIRHHQSRNSGHRRLASGCSTSTKKSEKK